VLARNFSGVQPWDLPYTRVVGELSEVVSEMYWTPGWGNVLTVAVTAFGVLVTNAVAGIRHRYDKEEARRDAQRGPVAEAIEEVLTLQRAAEKVVRNTVRLDHLPHDPTNVSWVKESTEALENIEAIDGGITPTTTALRKSELSVIDPEVAGAIRGLRANMLFLELALSNFSFAIRMPAESKTAVPDPEVAKERSALRKAVKDLDTAADRLIKIATANLRPQRTTKSQKGE